MRIWRTMMMVVLATTALAGCGKNPAAAPEAEKRLGQMAGLSKSSTKTSAVRPPTAAVGKTTKTSTATQKSASVSSKTGSPAVTGKPSALTGSTTPIKTGTTTTTPGGQTADGALKLTVRLWGTSPIGSLKLLVFSPSDPSQAAEVPLSLTGPEAVWENETLPPGQYTLRVQAFDPASKPIGSGSTQAVVHGGELTDLVLDVTTNKVADLVPSPGASGQSGIAGSPTPSAAPSAAPTAVPTAAPSAAPSPAPSGPGFGGTLGLHIEIF